MCEDSLLNRIPEDRRQDFIRRAADLSSWSQDLDESMASLEKMLRLNYIQSTMIESAVKLARFVETMRVDIINEYRLNKDEADYVEWGNFEFVELQNRKE